VITTRQLIAQARAREEAMARVEELLASASGTAHDLDGQVEVTVDARGKLLRLWLAPSAVDLGERLGPLVVEIAQAAMREATQDGYNKVALLLGEDMTAMIEQMTGMPAPARAERRGRGRVLGVLRPGFAALGPLGQLGGGVRAVQGFADDVRVAGVLGRLVDQVQDDPAGRPELGFRG
jgi:DNA-binding protein YbaB